MAHFRSSHQALRRLIGQHRNPSADCITNSLLFSAQGLRYRKLEVILTTTVEKLGKAGDTVKVAPGYFRNHLMPKLLAVPNIEKFAYLVREQRKLCQHEEEAKDEASEISDDTGLPNANKMKEYQTAALRLHNGSLGLKRLIKVDNELRTPITKEELVSEVARQLGICIYPENLHLPSPLTTVGQYEVPLRLPREPGYGESDPNPRRSPKSEALDVQELADALKLGSRFYLIGFSLGGHAVWASIKYIPGRLAGAALLAPVVNYRWPGFPKNLTREAYNKQQLGDQWALRVAYYAPWLLDWWMKQSWLPTSTVISGTTYLPNRLDAQLRDQFISSGAANERRKLATQQGIHESYFRDMMVMFGKWEFDPMDLLPPSFPVHLWQGDEDGLVPVTLQRYICSRLKWIECHELSMTGHYLSAIPGFGDLVLKTLLVPPST